MLGGGLERSGCFMWEVKPEKQNFQTVRKILITPQKLREGGYPSCDTRYRVVGKSHFGEKEGGGQFCMTLLTL